MKHEEKEFELNFDELSKHVGLLASYLSLLKEIPLSEDKKWILDAMEKEIELFSQTLLRKSISEDVMLERPIKVAALAKDVVKHMSRYAAKKGIFLELKAENGLSPAVGYPVAIRQALTKAIENAIKSSEEGDLVSVIVARVENRIKLEVRDQLGDSSFVLYLPMVPQGRSLLLEVLSEELRKRRDSTNIGAILVSLESYNEIKNLYGEKRSSKFVKKIEEQIRKVLRKEDEVISDGEGKFLVILGGTPTESILERVMNRINRVIEKTGEDIPPAFKSGYSLFSDVKELSPERFLNTLERSLN